MWKFFIIICFISSFDALASLNIECNHNYDTNYWVLGHIYCCHVESNPEILSIDSSHVISTNGTHYPGKTTNDVIGFDSYQKSFIYFPSGLDKIFRKLKLISIWQGAIKEIHQSDLSPFPNLVYLSLNDNDIDVLEAGLFDFNPKLEMISFSNNKIRHVDQNVFEKLPKLSYLCFNSNPCIAMEARSNIRMVQELIQIVKRKCVDSEIMTSRREIHSRKLEPKDISNNDEVNGLIAELREKIANLEEMLKNSK